MSTPRYCTLPGQSPVRLDSLDGHIIIITETPRPIPEQFILKAKAAGCLSEQELEALKAHLSQPVPTPVPDPVPDPVPEPVILPVDPDADSNFPDPPPPPEKKHKG